MERAPMNQDSCMAVTKNALYPWNSPFGAPQVPSDKLSSTKPVVPGRKTPGTKQSNWCHPFSIQSVMKFE